VDGSERFLKARQLVADAQQLFFLGFGFGRKNLERLFPSNYIRSKNTLMFGSCDGMMPGEITDAENRIPRAQSTVFTEKNHPRHIRFHDSKCYEFIRHFVNYLN